MQRPFLLVLAVVFTWVGCSPQSPSTDAVRNSGGSASPTEEEALLVRGQAISSQAFGLLSSNLQAAIERSGVSQALPFCSAVAMPLTSLVANTNEVSLQRVTHRPRNPVNRASPQELELIEAYRSALSRSEAPRPVLVTNETPVFYAPIVITNALCLQCHGNPTEDIAPENLALIRQLYPADEAIGFSMGEVRGLWRIQFR
jgi:hypothetical protein